jgi:hypothetical protein
MSNEGGTTNRRSAENEARRCIAGDIHIVEATIKECFPRLWPVTDACLSVSASLLLADLANPVGLNLLGPPSCGKTTVLSFFYDVPYCYKSDHFTPASFVSHSASVKKRDLPKIDMLPKIRNKVLVVPELAPIFSKRKEYLEENIGILVRVFDGQGLQTDSGAQGGRGYSGEYLFVWIGATTPLPYRVWQTMGKLGSRWLFMLMPKEFPAERQRELQVQDLVADVTYKDKVKCCRQFVHGFLRTLFEKYHWEVDKGRGGVKVGEKVEWNRKRDENHIRSIVSVAQLVARARSTVSMWRDNTHEGEPYSYAQPIEEVSSRLASILYNLARGHAIVHGRGSLNTEDVVLATKIALSSMQDDRREVVHLLLSEGTVSVDRVSSRLRVDPRTTRSLMKTLEVLRVVDVREEGVGSKHYADLTKEFQVLRSETEGLSGLVASALEDTETDGN